MGNNSRYNFYMVYAWSTMFVFLGPKSIVANKEYKTFIQSVCLN